MTIDRSDLTPWPAGYRHIFKRVDPLLRARGFTEETIRAITVDTPARILTLQPERIDPRRIPQRRCSSTGSCD